MKTKEITDLLTQYDNTLHEIDRLQEYKKEILNKLLESELPDGNKIKDIIETRFNTIISAMRANYPEESKYNYLCMGIAIDLRSFKKRKEAIEESRRRESKCVGGMTFKEKPRYWSELTM